MSYAFPNPFPLPLPISLAINKPKWQPTWIFFPPFSLEYVCHDFALIYFYMDFLQGLLHNPPP